MNNKTSEYVKLKLKYLNSDNYFQNNTPKSKLGEKEPPEHGSLIMTVQSFTVPDLEGAFDGTRSKKQVDNFLNHV